MVLEGALPLDSVLLLFCLSDCSNMDLADKRLVVNDLGRSSILSEFLMIEVSMDFECESDWEFEFEGEVLLLLRLFVLILLILL